VVRLASGRDLAGAMLDVIFLQLPVQSVEEFSLALNILDLICATVMKDKFPRRIVTSTPCTHDKYAMFSWAWFLHNSTHLGCIILGLRLTVL